MTWRELPNKLRIYIIVLAALAVPVISWSTWDVAHTPVSSGWIVLTVLTVLTVPFFLFLPSANAIVGIGDAYVVAMAMMFGPSPCIIATLCHSLTASVLVPNRPKMYRAVFNVSSMVCVAWIYSHTYKLINPSLSPNVPDMILPAVALTVHSSSLTRYQQQPQSPGHLESRSLFFGPGPACPSRSISQSPQFLRRSSLG